MPKLSDLHLILGQNSPTGSGGRGREREQVMNYVMSKCTKCKADTHPLAIFPDGLCMECYALTPEANAPITARELAQLWGGK